VCLFTQASACKVYIELHFAFSFSEICEVLVYNASEVQNPQKVRKWLES
jgi:hypothetical protein